jgi:MscS family membrane protein
MNFMDKEEKLSIKSTGGFMECSKVIACLMTLLLAPALFTVSADAQGLTSGEAKTPETVKVGYSLEEDIGKNPLKPPDTSSPRATLRSFLHNINLAYALLMDAHRENINAPGLFTSESVEQMGKRAEALLQRSAYCLNLSGVPDRLKQDVGYEEAIKLKEIFDRIELPPFEEIPDAKAIEAEEKREKIAELNRWRLPNTEIIIASVEEGPRIGEFLFDPKTVARLGEFYSKVKDLPYKLDTVISHDFFDFYITTPGLLLPPKWGRWVPAWSTAI